jgi:hypothetical protein
MWRSPIQINVISPSCLFSAIILPVFGLVDPGMKERILVKSVLWFESVHFSHLTKGND